ncbi:hypothetical protein [Gemmatimonas aurantiaca]|uniref:hypothetical protein n=1 Tax=Gemmatimonas aurantiaca TaxID=173480 RepID=UPI00301B892D
MTAPADARFPFLRMLTTACLPTPSPRSIPPFVDTDGITIRRVTSLEEYQECVQIQEEIWGPGFRERVPVAILLVAQKLTGVCAAAFAPDGRMLGFVFGLTGLKDGALAHWSDLLAVRKEARGVHIGERLKRYQRELCLASGLTTMYWTFDPLVARNAHLNLMRLGAHASEYVVNMYGSNTGSPLHGGVDTDRWVARWELTQDRVSTTPASIPMAGPAPLPGGLYVVRPALDDPSPVEEDHPNATVVRVAVPVDLDVLTPGQRAAWRSATRRAFTYYLGVGFEVVGFQRARGAEPPFYELVAPEGLSRSSIPS